jgi:1,5-anhydro-D-fructose reductase (1,5-anhydro-D-mannitol-forming)
MIRVAILGPGGISDEKLAPALAKIPGACLWSVLSRDLDRAKAFAAKHKASSSAPAYTDLELLLADPLLNAVLIATPDKLHAPQALSALQAGKHVLLEKPMVTSSQDGKKLVAEARARNLKLGVAYHLRWHAGHRLVIPRVRSGELGKPLHMRIRWTYQSLNANGWRAKPEVGQWWSLAAVGTHCLDLVRWAMLPLCGEVVEVVGITSNPGFQSQHDEQAVVGLKFASGATAEIFVSVLMRLSRDFEITTTEGSVQASETLGPYGGGEVRWNGNKLLFEVADPYEGELRDFVEAVQTGREPEVSGEEGVRNVEILEKAAM